MLIVEGNYLPCSHVFKRHMLATSGLAAKALSSRTMGGTMGGNGKAEASAQSQLRSFSTHVHLTFWLACHSIISFTHSAGGTRVFPHSKRIPPQCFIDGLQWCVTCVSCRMVCCVCHPLAAGLNGRTESTQPHRTGSTCFPKHSLFVTGL